MTDQAPMIIQESPTPLQDNRKLVPIPRGKARYSRAVMQMLDMQDQIYVTFKTRELEAGEQSQLALAFTRLQECIRVSRGIPSPGQLRPDLDPVQMARMLKRAKSRQAIDLPSDIRAALKTAKGKAWAEEPSTEVLPHDLTHPTTGDIAH